MKNRFNNFEGSEDDYILYLTGYLSSVRKKLKDENFLKNAPESILEKEWQKLSMVKDELSFLEQKRTNTATLVFDVCDEDEDRPKPYATLRYNYNNKKRLQILIAKDIFDHKDTFVDEFIKISKEPDFEGGLVLTVSDEMMSHIRMRPDSK